MQKTITIYGKTVKTSTGNTFISYTYKGKNNRFFNVRFTKNVRVTPPAGYTKITFDLEDASLTKTVDEIYNDILWIDSLINCEEDKAAIEAAKKRRVDALNEIL